MNVSVGQHGSVCGCMSSVSHDSVCLTNVFRCAPGNKWDWASAEQGRPGVSNCTGGSAGSEAGNGCAVSLRVGRLPKYMTPQGCADISLCQCGTTFPPLPKPPPQMGCRFKQNGRDWGLASGICYLENRIKCPGWGWGAVGIPLEGKSNTLPPLPTPISGHPGPALGGRPGAQSVRGVSLAHPSPQPNPELL